MRESIRISLLFAAAIVMIFGACGNAFVVLPDLHGDLVEIGVRPSVLGGTMLGLYFAMMAEFGFAAMVLIAAIQATRGIPPARIPLDPLMPCSKHTFGAHTICRVHAFSSRWLPS